MVKGTHCSLFTALLALVLMLSGSSLRAAAKEGRGADDLFAGNTIPFIEIEVSPEGMEILRAYEFNINLN